MTPKLRIEQRMSERRQRIGELLALDDMDAEQRGEMDTLTKGLQSDEVELRAAAAIETVDQQRLEAEHGKPEDRSRVELRSACSLAKFMDAQINGVSLTGAEAELASEIGLKARHIPLELFSPENRAEQRADALSESPSTVGVNFDPVVPAIFARAVATRLGIDMPRVPSGTYAVGTLTTSLTAKARTKSGSDAAIESTAAEITVGTTAPHRVSARLSVALEDVAQIGASNFESVLRQDLSLALSAQLDQYALNGDGSGANPEGLLKAIGAAADTYDVQTWGGFVSAAAGAIDGGPWCESLSGMKLLVNAETMRAAETVFQRLDGSTDTPGEMSAAAYLRAQTGGFMASSRMPDTDNHVAQAIRYRPGTQGLDGVDAVRTAVCPIWSEVGITDPYSDSDTGRTNVTLHVLLGDVLIVHRPAYQRVDLTISA